MSSFAQRRVMMVDTQVRPSDVTQFPIIDAMLSVPREIFVPADKKETAYMDGNLSLAEGRVLLEPRTMGKMLEVLNIQPDELVLDVGAGLGYSSAVLAQLGQTVVALEEDTDMASDAQDTLSAEGIDNVAVIEGALCEGAAKHGPYDVIVVQGAVETVPAALTEQLKDGGRIACLFQDNALGQVKVGYKTGTQVSWRFAFNAGAPILPGFEKDHSFAL